MWSLTGLFACGHHRTSFPLTPRDSANRRVTYVACLDCGKEFSYNWKEMRIEGPLDAPAASEPLVTGLVHRFAGKP
jgi:hypothetical protein